MTSICLGQKTDFSAKEVDLFALLFDVDERASAFFNQLKTYFALSLSGSYHRVLRIFSLSFALRYLANLQTFSVELKDIKPVASFFSLFFIIH